MKFAIEKEKIYIFSIVILMIISACSNTLIYLMMIAFCALFLWININKVNSESIIVPQIALALVLFQNFCIGVGAHLGGNLSDSLSLLTQVPTLFMGISYVVIILSNKVKKLDIIFLVYVILCLLYAFIGDGKTTAKIVYLRNFIVFYMAYTIGRYYLNTSKKINKYVLFFLRLSVIAVVFGIVALLLGKSFYHAIGVMEVYNAKQYSSYVDGLPGNFRTIFLGRWVNRLASLYYEPVNFSYFMALSTMVAFVLKKKTLFFVFLVCEILTFGKGGLLILALVFACIMVQLILKKYNAKLIRIFIITSAVVGIVILVYVIKTYYKDDFGTFNHFYGVETGIDAIKEKPMGHGLGTAGNLVKSENYKSQEISETGLINMAYQIGIGGMILFCYIFLSTSVGAFGQYKICRERFILMCSFVPLALLIVSVYQENTFSPQCIVPYMIFVGCSNNYVKTEREEVV